MKTSKIILLAAILLSRPVLAHPGPRIWIDQSDGRIITLTSDNDLSPTTYFPARVFTTELLNLGVYTTESPAYEVIRSGPHVSSGTTFGFNIAGPLLIFDNVADIFLSTRSKFGPPQAGPIPQMAISHETEIRSTGDGSVSGFNFFNYLSTGDHGHVSYTMIADGAPLDGPTGVYALPMTLTGTGLTASETYFLLMGKGVSPGSPLFNEAKSVAQAMIDFPADANFDGRITGTDLGRMAIHWQQSSNWSGGDFNFDGFVDVLDLMILGNNWYKGVGNLNPAAMDLGLPVSVPETTAIAVLGIGSLPLLARRRRGW